MTYLDTNVFIYALSKNVDDSLQKDIALTYLREAIEKDELITSDIILYEFAFVSKKLGEDSTKINENLEFIADFHQEPNKNLFIKVIEFMNKYELYKDSFDIYHLTFSFDFNCDRFITFDKGFKKLQKYVEMNIKIL